MTFFHYLFRRPLPSRTSVRALLTPPLRWYGVLLWVCIGGASILAYCTLTSINDRFLIPVPARGGTITEGIIGAPRLINPLLATTDTDRSLVRLLYSGLMRQDVDGTIIPDLATSYSSSSDGLVYTFTIHNKLKWSSGKALTSADVAFSMSQTLNGIGITTPDEHTIVFTLPTPDETFLSKMTIGITPKYVWEGIEVDTPIYNRNNLFVVGSGPFKVSSIQSEHGIPTEITLKPNRHYVGKKPYIKTYRVVFFNNQSELLDALNSGTIDLTMSAASDTVAKVTNDTIVGKTVSSTKHMMLIALTNDAPTTMFGASIDALIDKALILAIVENGYGILPSATNTTRTLNSIGTPVALNVENDPQTLSVAQALQDQLEKIGITLPVKAFDHGTFQTGIDGRSFSLVLVESSTVPAGYQRVSTLYTVGYPFLYTSTSYPILPELVQEPADRYQYITDWHARINKVWKIFTH